MLIFRHTVSFCVGGFKNRLATAAHYWFQWFCQNGVNEDIFWFFSIQVIRCLCKRSLSAHTLRYNTFVSFIYIMYQSWLKQITSNHFKMYLTSGNGIKLAQIVLLDHWVRGGYLGGGGDQLSPHHCGNRAGCNKLKSLPVWDSAGLGSWWTEAKARAEAWGRGSLPLLAATQIRGGATIGGLCRVHCPRFIEGVGSENRVGIERWRAEVRRDENISY